MVEQFQMISQMGRTAMPTVEHGLGAGMTLLPEKYNMPIEELNLSVRAYNCLRRGGLMTVGQVLEKREEQLLVLRNFGQKSYDELRQRLDEFGFLPADGSEEVPEALPIEDGERPLSASQSPADKVSTTKTASAEAPATEVPSQAKTSRKKSKAQSTEEPAQGDDELSEWQRQLMNLKDSVESDDKKGSKE